MLNKEQVNELFIFCEKHLVRFYDIQLELVDHLANAIEEKMAADKNLAFETALAQVYHGFGPMGFGFVASARYKAIENQYRKTQWKLFCAYFTLPKVAMTVCLFFLLSLPYRLLDGIQLAQFAAVAGAVPIVYEIYIVMMLRRKEKKTGKPLLIISMQMGYAFSSFIILFPFLYPTIFGVMDAKPFHSFFTYELYVFAVLIFLLGVFAFRDAALKMYGIARERYPEAFETAL